uniref:PiggyBac transposable element-derived protein domain-containing protein n=1 Tax=Amphiprion percula TaxID=161767 RepID=A0A3P8TSD3_AMPPE
MADSDSEEEYSPSDEVQSSSDTENEAASVRNSTASVRLDSPQAAHTGADALLHRVRGGKRGRGGCSRGGRRGRGGCSRVDQNTANGEVGSGDAKNRRNGGRRGRSRGRKCTANTGGGRSGIHCPTVNDDDNDGWVCLRDEEEHHKWIRHFDEPVGYREDRNLTNSEPIGFLSLFLDAEFWSLITNETNRYAHQFLEREELKPNSRFHDWYDVTVPEMKAFMALHLCMGLVEKSEIEDYWDGFWPTYTPGFGKVMSRNRFEVFLSFIHFVNNDERVERGLPGHDRLFKVRPIINMIIPRFSAIYGPHKELSLDEMIIAFKGRSTLKLEVSSGYVLQWSMYTGQNTHDDENIGATHLIVRQLLAPYTGKGHEVYMDSYYTSPAISRELANNDTGMCGTVNCNRRGMPRVFMRHDKLLACAFHDTNRLTLLSTIHGNLCTKKRIRTKENVTGFREIEKPVCVDSYNTFMGGVDTADQRMKTYLFPHRSRKWYSRIFNAVVSISVVNAHIIYTRCNPGQQKTLKVFIQSIITSLLEGYSKKEGKKGGRPSMQQGEVPQRLTERHWLRNTDDRLDCIVCSDHTHPKGRRQAQFRCSQCGVGLCAVPCNEIYHTLKHYKEDDVWLH